MYECVITCTTVRLFSFKIARAGAIGHRLGIVRYLQFLKNIVLSQPGALRQLGRALIKTWHCLLQQNTNINMDFNGKRYCSLGELEDDAKKVLEKSAYGYLSSGAESEWTLRENVRAYENYCFIPRCLVNVSRVDTRTRILGIETSMPVLVAPMAMQKLCHHTGEVGMAEATKRQNVPMVLSTMSTSSMEDVVATGNEGLLFQVYVLTERAITEAMVRQAEQQGFKGIVITVDAPRLGKREVNEKEEFSLPDSLSLKIIENHGAEAAKKDHALSLSSKFGQKFSSLIDDTLTWDIIPWMRAITNLPIFVKGILSSYDARLAVDHGVDGIIVSNHGGRQLDYAVPSVECLVDIAKAVDKSVPVWIDGGIRRGSDVVKCLAMGADAVLIGRPFLWSLALGGATGVEQALRCLQQDIERSMALVGCPDIHQLGPELIQKYRLRP